MHPAPGLCPSRGWTRSPTASWRSSSRCSCWSWRYPRSRRSCSPRWGAVGLLPRLHRQLRLRRRHLAGACRSHALHQAQRQRLHAPQSRDAALRLLPAVHHHPRGDASHRRRRARRRRHLRSRPSPRVADDERAGRLRRQAPRLVADEVDTDEARAFVRRRWVGVVVTGRSDGHRPGRAEPRRGPVPHRYPDVRRRASGASAAFVAWRRAGEDDAGRRSTQ